MEINKEDIKRHFKLLNFEKEAEIRVIGVDGGAISYFISDSEKLIELCKEKNQNNHIYIGINEREPGKTTAESVKAIRNMVIDIDNKTDFQKTQELAFKIKEDGERKGYKKLLLLCSGNGFHLYYPLDNIPNTEANRKRLKKLGEDIKRQYKNDFCEIDTAVFDVARVMRLAGTYNVKPNVQKPCFIVENNERQNCQILTQKIQEIPLDDEEYGETNKDVFEILDKYNISKEHPWLYDLIKNQVVIKPNTGRNDVIVKYTAMICVMYSIPKSERTVIAKEIFKSCKESNLTTFEGWITQLTKKNKIYDSYKNHINKFIRDNEYPLTQYILTKEEKDENRKYVLNNLLKGIGEYSEDDEIQQILKIISKLDEINREKYLKKLKEKINVSLGSLRKKLDSLLKEQEKSKNNFEKTIEFYFDKRDLAKRFIEIQPLFYERKGLFWIWDFNDNCYVKKDETDILNAISKSSYADTISSKEKNEILEALKQVGRLNKPEDIKPTWIQFKDKIYDVATGEVFKATPKYFTANPIKRNVGESEETPYIDKLIDSWVKGNDKQRLYEIIAFTLVPKYFIHSFWFLYSPPGMGKSTFTNLIIKFIGEHNCVSTSLHRINKNPRFETLNWHKKLLITLSEVSNVNELKNTSLINEATGEDLIRAEIKGGESFDFVNYGKFVYPTNKLLRVDEKDGFGRRVRYIEFKNRFEKERDVLNEIPEWEFENLAKKCLRIAGELWKKRQFTGDVTISERMHNYQDISKTPIERFIDSYCDLTDVEAKITFDEFYGEFIKYLKNKGEEILHHNKNVVGRELKKLGFEKKLASWKTGQNTIGGETAYTQKMTIFGIKFKEKQEIDK